MRRSELVKYVESIGAISLLILLNASRPYFPEWWEQIKEAAGWTEKAPATSGSSAPKTQTEAIVPETPVPKPKTAEQVIAETVDSILRFQGQEIITQAHPTVTLKTYRVHEIVPVWRNQLQTGNLRDVEGCAIRATLYWQGVVQKEGFTKVNLLVDFEALRIVGGEIIATNGMTSDEMGKLTLDLAKGALQGYLLYQQLE